MENNKDITQFRNEVNYGQDLLILILHVQDELRFGRDGDLALNALRGSLLDEISEYLKPQIETIEKKYNDKLREIETNCWRCKYSYNPNEKTYMPTLQEKIAIEGIPIIKNTEILNRIINALNKFGILLQTMKHVETGKEPIYQS